MCGAVVEGGGAGVAECGCEGWAYGFREEEDEGWRSLLRREGIFGEVRFGGRSVAFASGSVLVCLAAAGAREGGSSPVVGSFLICGRCLATKARGAVFGLDFL